MSKFPCISCKGKNPSLCGRTFCPIYAQSQASFKVVEKVDNNFLGNTPPTVFIGSRLTYPNVNVGILSPIEDKEGAWKYDAPNYWYENKIDIKRIIEYRSGLINSRFKTQVASIRNSGKLLSLAQELGMVMKPSSVEFELKNKPTLTMNFSQVSLPLGPNAELKNAKLAENVSIPKPIDKVNSDVHLKAVEGMRFLNSRGYNEHQLSQLLSVGSMGMVKNRILVPTRNSITAVDDFLGKEIIKEVKNYNLIDDCELLFGNYLGNYFLVLLLPGVWSYELFEMYLPKTLWNVQEIYGITTDYENYFGRKNYAEETSGGYYAARLAALEYLKSIKKQASILLLRFITSEYEAPLGVFVVRQAVREAVKNKVSSFENRKFMLDYIHSFCLRRFNYNISLILLRSKLLTQIEKQMRLSEWN